MKFKTLGTISIAVMLQATTAFAIQHGPCTDGTWTDQGGSMLGDNLCMFCENPSAEQLENQQLFWDEFKADEGPGFFGGLWDWLTGGDDEEPPEEDPGEDPEDDPKDDDPEDEDVPTGDGGDTGDNEGSEVDGAETETSQSTSMRGIDKLLRRAMGRHIVVLPHTPLDMLDLFDGKRQSRALVTPNGTSLEFIQRRRLEIASNGENTCAVMAAIRATNDTGREVTFLLITDGNRSYFMQSALAAKLLPAR